MSDCPWLAERLGNAPPELSAAISSALSSADDRASDRHDRPEDGEFVASQLIVAAERLLPRVVFHDCRERSGALDLLTLDALVTFAMEASAKSAAECEEAAHAILAAIGAAAGTG